MGVLGIPLDSQDDRILEQRIAIPYVTTQPTETPSSDGTRRIYFDGTDYWLYIYANAGWRTEKLDGSSLATDLNISGQQAGDIIYFNGSNWVRLAAGTAGYRLRSNASANAPEYVADLSAIQMTNSAVFVDNTATDTVMRSLTVPAMAANDLLVIHILSSWDKTVQNSNDKVKLKVGSTTLLILSDLITAGTSNGFGGFTVYIGNKNSTSSQGLWGSGVYGKTTTMDSLSSSTSTLDTSSSFTLDYVGNIAVANAEATMTTNFFIAQILKG